METETIRLAGSALLEFALWIKADPEEVLDCIKGKLISDEDAFAIWESLTKDL